MSILSDKTTIYLSPSVKKFIKHKAVAEGSSVSEIINDYFQDMVEDLDDVADISNRRSEQTVPLKQVLKELSLTYDDLQS